MTNFSVKKETGYIQITNVSRLKLDFLESHIAWVRESFLPVKEKKTAEEPETQETETEEVERTLFSDNKWKTMNFSSLNQP